MEIGRALTWHLKSRWSILLLCSMYNNYTWPPFRRQFFIVSFICSLAHSLATYLPGNWFHFSLPQENKLKVALLEYLRRQHPEDTDKFSMVAHHFSMYREIAQTLEETAVKQLASLGDCFPGTYFACLLQRL